ncbi:MAG TPA: hypothetical protein VLL25_14755 [Acidimicrobiales bacterium]|nr:hypothetical protein [Acidimicrobiales bacterium]
MAGPSVMVRFIADNKDFKKGVDDADQAAGGFKANLLKVGAAIGVAFSATKVVEFVKDSVKAAQDLNANLSRTNTIFGESAGAVIDWSKTTAKSMGIAQADSLAAANAIGKTLVGSFGLSTEAAAGMSKGVVELAKDMATFNRVPFDQALEAVQKGLTGNARGLKDLGVVMSDAEIKQKAVTLGLSDGQKALDPATKAQASYALMLEKTTLQQGATARASGSLGATQDRMKAQWKDMQASLGQALLPALTELAKIAGDYVVPALKSMGEFFVKNKSWVLPLGAAILGVVVALKLAHAATVAWKAIQQIAKAATVAWTAVQWLWNAAMMANPLVLIAIAIAAVIAIVVALLIKFGVLKTIMKAVGDVFSAVWDFILGAIKAVWNWIKDNWPLLLAILTGPFGLAIALIVKNWDTIKDAVKAVFDFIVNIWDAVISFLISIPGRILDALKDLWKFITDGLTATKDFIVNIWDAVISFLTSIPGRILDALKSLWKFITDGIRQELDFVRGIWDSLIEFLKSIPGRILNALKSLWKFITDGIRQEKDFIVNIFNDLVGFVTGLPGRIASAAAGMWDGIKNAFKGAINWIIHGWNSIEFKIPGFKIGPIGWDGFTLGLPKIPELARGGIVSRPTLAMLGEAGREIVAPEPVLRDIVRSEGRSGPAVVIQNATFQDEADIEMLMRRVEFELVARRL